MKQALQDIYLKHGFKITPYLQDVIETYGSSWVPPQKLPELVDRHGRVVRSRWEGADWTQIEFCPVEQVSIGADYAMYQSVSAFLGSRVAPVGTTHRENIELLITGDGRMVGVNDYLVMTWGKTGCGWRDTLAAYLVGEEAVVLGNAAGDDDEDEQGL